MVGEDRVRMSVQDLKRVQADSGPRQPPAAAGGGRAGGDVPCRRSRRRCPSARARESGPGPYPVRADHPHSPARLEVAHQGHLYQLETPVPATEVVVEERLDGTRRITHQGHPATGSPHYRTTDPDPDGPAARTTTPRSDAQTD